MRKQQQSPAPKHHIFFWRRNKRQIDSGTATWTTDSGRVINHTNHQRSEQNRKLEIVWHADSADGYSSSDNDLAKLFLQERRGRGIKAHSPNGLLSFQKDREPSEIRSLNLSGYPREALPGPQLRALSSSLVALTISNADRLIDLKGVEYLKNLESIAISDCSRLQSLCGIFGNSQKYALRHLEIRDCPNLRAIPPEIGRLQNLASLQITACDQLETLPPEIGVALQRLQEFQMTGCRNITSFPSEFAQLKNLSALVLDSTAMPMFASLSDGLAQMKRLQYLELKMWCDSVFPEELCNLESLQELRLSSLMRSIEIPSSVTRLSNLKKLRISFFRQKTPLGRDEGVLSNLQLFPNLESLELFGVDAHAIKELFREPWRGSPVLKRLDLSRCLLGDDDYGAILPAFPDSLVELGLGYTRILGLEGFVEHGLPPGIRRLVLTGNPVLLVDDDKQRGCLGVLLDRYNNLEAIVPPRAGTKTELITPSLHFKMLLNGAGRIFLPRAVCATYVSGSLLPVVLRRLATKLRGAMRQFGFAAQRYEQARCLNDTKRGTGADGVHRRQLDKRTPTARSRNTASSPEQEIEASVLYRVLRARPDLLSGRAVPASAEPHAA